LRTTRDTLVKLARDTVKERVSADRNLVAAYLVGSTLRDDPFLGGAADVDIVFLCIQPPLAQREILRLGSDFHLDMYFRGITDFEPPRKLRTDSLLGYVIYAPVVLYDTRRFLEYAQAIVRAQFDDPPNRLARVRHHSDPARRLWMELQSGAGEPRPVDMLKYLQGVHHAAQAFALFDGPPLSERRFLLEFADRAVAADSPELHESLLDLVGGMAFDSSETAAMLPAWESAFVEAARTGENLSVHPARLNYYKHAIEALLKGDAPSAALWPLVHTWTVAAASLASYSDEAKIWSQAFSALGLAGEGFEYRLQGLDRFLDTLEEKCDSYAAEYSLEQ
jgi:predicted nucleotidyltransferase